MGGIGSLGFGGVFGRALVSVRSELRVAFVVFVAGFLTTFYAMRYWVWPALMRRLLETGAVVVAVTPFDVVLLQAKLGLVSGAVFALAWLAYRSRPAMRARGVVPGERRMRLLVAILALALFVGGVAYAYVVFLPLLFDFLVSNAIRSGFRPTYSITEWTQFVLLLTLVLGLTAELPLVMGGLVYAEVVSYGALRNRWRHAVFGIVVVSSMVNGSPDPFSMALVAIPMSSLYAVGLGCALVVSNVTTDRSAGRHAVAVSDSDSDATTGSDAPDTEQSDAATDRPLMGAVERTAVGMADAFTEDETNEDDIGGYYYDLRFVLDSLAAKSFHIAGLFALVVGTTFTFLYSGGIELLKRDFLARLPESVPASSLDIVLLHPVDALAFEMKLSLVAGVVAVLPLVCYYAWPAVAERGLAGGDRNVFVVWSAVLTGGILAGSAVGYRFVAPAVVSALVADAVAADMIIAYRIAPFFWLVFATTVGVGLWVEVPLTMVLFHHGGIVSYRTMRRRWREVTIGVLVLASLLPGGLLLMLGVGVAVTLAYWTGLGLLWVVTLGERLLRPATA